MDTLREVLDHKLFSVGGSDVTVERLLLLLVLVFVMVVATRWLRRWTVRMISRRAGVHPGVAEALGSILRYAVVAVLLVVTIGTLGVDISALAVVAGVLGIGIGLGLQGLVKDFVSGIVLLVERPIKVGDRIEVGDLAGNVTRISPRATTIQTNDNISIIVPNSHFVSNPVINWSHGEPEVRLRVAVPVAYHSDPVIVRQVLVAAASAVEGVASDRPPDVLFDGFGDSALEFTVRVWTRELATRPGVLRSDLNFAILAALRAAGIEIPFPQRELRFRPPGTDA